MHSGPDGGSLGASLPRRGGGTKRDLGDFVVSETSTAGAAAPTGSAALVDAIYAAVPCLAQEGNQPCAPTAVSDAGDGGPALLFWQATGYALQAPILGGMQPLFNNQGDVTLAASCFFNQNAVRLPLLRRRALLGPQPPGESFVSVNASQYCATDESDSVNMAMVNLGSMSEPVQVQLSASGMAEGTNQVYTSQIFNSSGGVLVISVDATAWSSNPNTPISAMLYIDGEPAGVIGLFANPAGTHLPMVGADLAVPNIAAGGHQLDLVGQGSTVVDDNDVWSLTVIEMTGNSIVSPVASQAPPAQQGGGTLLNTQYKSVGGESLICVTLSGWTATANQLITAQVLVDGNPVGTLQSWASQSSMHIPLACGDIAAGQLPPGMHQLTIVAGPNTITDANDRMGVVIFQFFP